MSDKPDKAFLVFADGEPEDDAWYDMDEAIARLLVSYAEETGTDLVALREAYTLDFKFGMYYLVLGNIGQRSWYVTRINLK